MAGASMHFFKSISYKDEIIIHSKIEMIDIELSERNFPRIFNIKTWLEKKGIIVELRRHNEYKSLVYHIILLHTGYSTTDTIVQLFGSSDITKHSFPHSVTGIERLKRKLDGPAGAGMPIVLMFLFKSSLKGTLCNQDTDLVESILSGDLKQIDIIFVTNEECYIKTKELLTEVSSSIFGRPVLGKIVTRLGKRLKERTGLYLERKTKNMFTDSIQKLHLEGKLKISEEAYRGLISELKETQPDSCDMHELEVCLERLDVVRAYGYEDDTITVYLNESKGREKVIDTLKEAMPGIFECISIELWDKTIQIQKCSKQGSKIARCDDRYGTLGLFLKDNKGNVYFTTCAHVVPEGATAYDNDKNILGKSVKAIDTSQEPEREDCVDLSIVKVNEIALSKCQFGLRNTHDQLVNGIITGESVIRSEAKKGLPIFKWGATTGLTRGTYKGWIAKKNSEDRFDRNLHRIEGIANQIFEEGDSGSLVCFEATGSPQLQSDSAAYIFVGKLMSSDECSTIDLQHLYYCYHISNVLDCKLENNEKVQACLYQNPNI